MIVVWILGLVAGVVVAALASRRAVGAALEASEALGVSTGLVGFSVVAVGTDLPEIANSITASLADHGDINVGDSTGSALTQVTLVLALLVLAAGLSTESQRRESSESIAVPAGLVSVGALVLLAVMISDQHLSRSNGLVLVAVWVATLVWMHRRSRGDEPRPRVADEHISRSVGRTIGWLLVVGAAAMLIVRAFVEITDRIGVPEFVASSIVLAIGTSVPELVVDWTAIRRGAAALAIGDLFGATLADSTLSVGAGPIVRATAVSNEAMIGTLVIAVGVAVATLVVGYAQSRRSLAATLLAIYGVSLAVLITIAS
jgi:cation:H+ antiporter